jgi:transketolase
MASEESVISAIKTCQAQVEKLKAEWQSKLEMYEQFVPDKRSRKLLSAKEGEATKQY